MENLELRKVLAPILLIMGAVAVPSSVQVASAEAFQAPPLYEAQAFIAENAGLPSADEEVTV